MKTSRAVAGAGAIVGLFLSTAAVAETPVSGSISGKVKSHWLEKGYELVVYVERAREEPFPMPKARPEMSQKNLVYVPHILPIAKGWEVEFHSQDEVLHNLLARFKASFFKRASQLFNIAMPPGTKPLVKRFEKEGVVNLLCSIHTEMSAYILVLQNPYFAKVGKNGRFAIEGIPPEKYELKVWGEKLTEDQLEKRLLVVVSPGGVSSIDLAP